MGPDRGNVYKEKECTCASVHKLIARARVHSRVSFPHFKKAEGRGHASYPQSECCCSELRQLVLPTLPQAQNPEGLGKGRGKGGNNGVGENAVGPDTDISTASTAEGVKDVLLSKQQASEVWDPGTL